MRRPARWVCGSKVTSHLEVRSQFPKAGLEKKGDLILQLDGAFFRVGETGYRLALHQGSSCGVESCHQRGRGVADRRNSLIGGVEVSQ